MFMSSVSFCGHVGAVGFRSSYARTRVIFGGLITRGVGRLSCSKICVPEAVDLINCLCVSEISPLLHQLCCVLVLMIRLPFTTVVVGPPGEWCTRVNKDRSRDEVWRHRELQAPVPWKTYVHKSGLRCTTNAAYLKRTWVRPLGSDGPGKETKALATDSTPCKSLYQHRYHGHSHSDP